MLETEQTRGRLREQTLEYLNILQRKPDNAVTYPGATEDWLFRPTYRHKHRNPSKCLTCDSGTDRVCGAALKLSCQELGCDPQELVSRERSKSPPGVPTIHFGIVASGDSVMKSGEDRDREASRHGLIAFEMEGAGVWEIFPNCLVIKGVCDYADSHKSKSWQAHAAATATATLKAVLENWETGKWFTAFPLCKYTFINTDTRGATCGTVLNIYLYWICLATDKNSTKIIQSNTFTETENRSIAFPRVCKRPLWSFRDHH